MSRPPARRTATTEPEVPRWITLPIQAVAVVVVVPLRLLWELVTVVGRFVNRYVLTPLAWLLDRAVRRPLAWLGRMTVRYVLRPIAWVLHRVVFRPLGYLLYYIVVVPLEWVWKARHPVGRFLRRTVLVPLGWLAYHLLWRPLAWTGRVLLLPVLVAFGRGLAYGWRLTGAGLRLLYRYLLRPIGIAVAFVWTYTIGLVWRWIVVPVWRWVRDAVLRPAAAATRSVLRALGLR